MISYGWVSDSAAPSTRICMVVADKVVSDKMVPYLTSNIGVLAVLETKGGGPRFDKIYMCVDLTNWGDSATQRARAVDWFNTTVKTMIPPGGEILWLA